MFSSRPLTRVLLLGLSVVLVVVHGTSTTTTTAGPSTARATVDVDRQITNLYATFRLRAATDVERVAATTIIDRSGPGTLIDDLALSEEWLGPFVDEIYRRALGRSPDRAGRAYWIAQLQTGATTTEILDPILASDEFRARTSGPPDVAVAGLFERILQREVDEAGAAYWSDTLTEVGAATVAAALLDSEEYRRRQVQDLYTRLLCRTADDVGIAYWAARIGQGRDLTMARTIANTPEFLDRTRPCTVESGLVVEPGTGGTPPGPPPPTPPPTPLPGGPIGASADGSVQVTSSGFTIVHPATGSRRTLVGAPVDVSPGATRALTLDGTRLRVHDLESGRSSIIDPDWDLTDDSHYTIDDDGVVVRSEIGPDAGPDQRHRPVGD